ncbi:rho-associated protein kinase let-502 [Vespula squamosa]|uniref:Rho-associated protein kinase let-502 n=1 Tax=Vespula squamosa TaxID=30214 RepID=A0ABD2BF38_VESSQ
MNSIQEEIPTQTEVGLHLGLPLAKVLFAYDHQETKKLLGLIPPLKHVSGDFWISPCAQISKKVLSLPQNNNIIKECTHLGILALGQDLLNKWKAEIEAYMKKECKKQLIDQKYLYEAEKRHAIKVNTRNVHTMWQKYINIIECNIQKELQTELAKVILKCNKEIQKTVIQQRINMTQHMLSKIRKEMSYMVADLYEEFEQTRRLHIENIIADVNEILRKEHIKNNKKIEKLKKEKAESLYVQKVRLETKNIANIMYMLCLERLHSNLEKQKIQNDFQNKLCNMQNIILDLKKILNTTKETSERYQSNNELLQEKFDKINEEFHKFVTFAFNSVPKQTEFVLPSGSIYSEQMDQTSNEKLDKYNRICQYVLVEKQN